LRYGTAFVPFLALVARPSAELMNIGLAAAIRSFENLVRVNLSPTLFDI